LGATNAEMSRAEPRGEGVQTECPVEPAGLVKDALGPGDVIGRIASLPRLIQVKCGVNPLAVMHTVGGHTHSAADVGRRVCRSSGLDCHTRPTRHGQQQGTNVDGQPEDVHPKIGPSFAGRGDSVDINASADQPDADGKNVPR
jgi:hypothetical protein